jgi:hypothetical protein
MSIIHDKLDLRAGRLFLFAQLGGISCSICAPNDVPQAEIEEFAATLAEPDGGRWLAIDKSKMGLGEPTPNPCNQDYFDELGFRLDVER